jgi:PAS domain S-box-containing protein
MSGARETDLTGSSNESAPHAGAAPELLEAALDAVITLDSTGCIVQFNSAAEAMFGYARKEAVGKRLAELIIPLDLRAEHRAGIARLVAGGPARILDRRVQQRALRRGGEQFPVELTVTQTSESPLLFTGFIRDLTSVRRAQDEATRRAELLAAAEELVHMGTWERELGTGRTMWSDELYRIHGFEPGDVEPSVDLVIELAHPEDRDYVAGVLSPIDQAPERIVGKDITLEYRVVRRDGLVREIRARGRVEPDESGEPARWVGSALDLTELRLTERELQAHAAVGNALRDWASFEEGVVGLLRRLGMALDFGLGSAWACDPDQDRLSCRAFWSAPQVQADEFEAATRALSLRPGEGVAGRAWLSGGPVFSESVAADPSVARPELGAKLGLQSGLAFAAVTDEEPLAVLAYYSFDRRVPSKRLFRTLSGIGRELGRFFSQHRAELGPTRLTERELEILRLAAEGNTGPAIAEQLVVSPSTVKSHFENIYAKLGVSDRAAAVAQALRIGLIS